MDRDTLRFSIKTLTRSVLCENTFLSICISLFLYIIPVLTSSFSRKKALESELAARKPRTGVLLKEGDELSKTMPYASMKIEECIDTLTGRWDSVEERAKQRKQRLQEILNLYQVLYHLFCFGLNHIGRKPKVMF